MKNKALSLASLVVRIVVASIFIFGTITKIADIGTFAEQVYAYKIVSPFLSHVTAITLPWIELATGVLMIVGLKLRASSLVTAFWLVVFIGAVAIAMMKGLNIDCGCHGVSEMKVGFKKIAENIVLLAGTAFVFLFPGDFTYDKFIEKS